MDEQTKQMINNAMKYRDSFWQNTIRYVCEWLVGQGFEITYKGIKQDNN